MYLKRRSKALSISKILLLLALVSCTKYTVEEGLKSSIDTRLLSIENINTDLDIIHLTADQERFDSLMNHPSMELEIPAIFNMYSKGEAIIENKNIELENKGSATLWYPLKSLKVKFKSKVNNSLKHIIEPERILPNHHLDELKKISLRNSGSDFYKTFICDISFTELAIRLGLDVELGYHKPVHVFVNDQYYGLLNLRTEKDDNSLGKLLQVDNDDLNILKIVNDIGSERIEFKDGDENLLQALVDATRSGDLEYLLQHVDLNSFADYVIYEDFIGNSDWPYNNVEIYSVGTLGKFRFFLYDMDMAIIHDKYTAIEDEKQNVINQMYRTLMQDAHFSQLIIERRTYIFQHSTEELFNNILDENARKIENEIDYNIAKFGIPNSKLAWYYEIQRMKEQFDFRKQYYGKHYNLR